MASHSQNLIVVFAITISALTTPLYAQINTACSSSMLNTFSPCINFITSSNANISTPSSDCCNSLSTVMSNGTDCLCLIATGGVPFQIPINRTLAVSLPRACNMPAGVPLQCRTASTPIPAPGPAALSPSIPSPTGSVVPESVSPALAPESDVTPPTITTNSGSRPVLTPSAAFHHFPSPLLLVVFAASVLKYYYI